MLDRSSIEAKFEQLSPRQDPVLALGELPGPCAATSPIRPLPHPSGVKGNGARFLPVNGGFQTRSIGRNGCPTVEAAPMIEVSRTLMKSEPELAELIEAAEGVEVTMAEKGFGTRVEIRAREGSGLSVEDLERILDELAEPQKQPFSA